jgi:hypothetical protein
MHLLYHVFTGGMRHNQNYYFLKELRTHPTFESIDGALYTGAGVRFIPQIIRATDARLHGSLDPDELLLATLPRYAEFQSKFFGWQKCDKLGWLNELCAESPATGSLA